MSSFVKLGCINLKSSVKRVQDGNIREEAVNKWAIMWRSMYLMVRPCPCWFDSQTSGCVFVIMSLRSRRGEHLTSDTLWMTLQQMVRWCFLYYYCYCYLTPFCFSPLSVTCELMLEIMSTCNKAHMIITQVIGFYFFHALLEIIFVSLQRFHGAISLHVSFQCYTNSTLKLIENKLLWFVVWLSVILVSLI